MEIMTISQISPDQVILWQWKWITINATLVYTWLIMAILILSSWFITRNLSPTIHCTRWQNFLEVVVSTIRNEINEVSKGEAGHYLPFIGTLFLFIALSNLLAVVPGYVPPTSSLTTTSALAVCVFIAVPIFGITKQGLKEYVKEYFRPTFIFFPFHVMGELSRTLALMVRLFGNIMSHEKVIAILLSVTPFFFPIVMQALGLLIGFIQAYIFSILAMVYIASATQSHEKGPEKAEN